MMWRWVSYDVVFMLLLTFACGVKCFVVSWAGADGSTPVVSSRRPHHRVVRQPRRDDRRRIQRVSVSSTSSDDESFSKDSMRPRCVAIDEGWNVTIYEYQHASDHIDGYWESSNDKDLDPFGFVAWPGSVMAARELRQKQDLVDGKNVLILGAGVGIEAQAALALGAQHVIATDINPATLALLEHGITKNASSKIETKLFDISKYDEPLPEPFDLLVVADVLYDEDLVKHVAQRCREADPRPALVTDSQNFVTFPKFSNLETSTVELESFTGSGVVIEGDQTYDVDVTVHWLRRP